MPSVVLAGTPSVETEARPQRLVRSPPLPERIGRSPPSIEVVDLRRSFVRQATWMVSSPLAAGELDARADGDQAILVINRRGTASVVLCRDDLRPAAGR